MGTQSNHCGIVLDPNRGTCPAARLFSLANDEPRTEQSWRGRPELVESLYVLWRLDPDEPRRARYREIGWEIFVALRRCCRLEWGYAPHLRDVGATLPQLGNHLESYFFAETLKYLFLLFSPEETFDLDAHVLTTEAHPLPRPPLHPGALERAAEPEDGPPPKLNVAWW